MIHPICGNDKIIFSIFVSTSFLIAAYKLAIVEMNVPVNYVILTIIVYIATNVGGILNTLRLVKKGYFRTQRKMENPMGIIFAMGLLGLGVGRLLLGKINQDTAVTILIIGLIFLGFLFSIGSHNILKYFLANRLQKKLGENATRDGSFVAKQEVMNCQDMQER